MSLTMEEERIFDLAEQNKDYFVQNFGLLRKNYPDEYVAIANRNVVLHDKSLDELLQRMRSELGEDRSVIVAFVPSKHSPIAV